VASETILLVDDEEPYRTAIRRILESKGYTVLEADTYQRALRVFAENSDSITLLLTDISLPGGNGCELWVSMRTRKPDLNVLFISGHVGAEVCRFHGLEPSHLHFLGKPFKVLDLLARVKQILVSSEFPKLHEPYWKAKGGDGQRTGNGDGGTNDH
jgi:DNA-binding response OmpR family regulator